MAALAAFACVSLGLTGCVTKIKPQTEQNPPPSEKFSNFTRFELQPLKVTSSAREVHPAVAKKIQDNIDLRLRERIDAWNAKGAGATTVRTLVIEPQISDLKFVSGGKRFWVGSLGGSSAVVVHAVITEKETGKEIAHPEFFARAAAMGGAWTFGATDNVMLVRIANSFTTYVTNNYDQAVGGPVIPPKS